MCFKCSKTRRIVLRRVESCTNALWQPHRPIIAEYFGVHSPINLIQIRKVYELNGQRWRVRHSVKSTTDQTLLDSAVQLQLVILFTTRVRITRSCKSMH